jgi:hypothetical protein
MEAYLRRQAAFETYYRRRHFLRPPLSSER